MSTTTSIEEMLRAFLRAELDSPTESENLRRTLVKLRFGEELIHGDVADAETLLRVFGEYRGWQDVFDGLDFRAMDWSIVELDLEDLRFKTLTCKNHFEQEYGTRQPVQIASAWDCVDEANGVVAKIVEGQVLEPPILIGDPGFTKLVILEGHNRLISYLRLPDKVPFPITAIVGTAEHVSQWSQW